MKMDIYVRGVKVGNLEWLDEDEGVKVNIPMIKRFKNGNYVEVRYLGIEDDSWVKLVFRYYDKEDDRFLYFSIETIDFTPFDYALGCAFASYINDDDL